MFIGCFFTQVLPTSIGGDAVRILLAGRRGLPYGKAFSGVVLESGSGLLAPVIMVAGGVLWLGDRLEPPALGLLLLLALPGLLAVLAGSEEHTSDLQSLMRISYAVVWLEKK